MPAPLQRASARSRPDYLAFVALGVTVAFHVGLKLASDSINPWFIGGATVFWIGLIVFRCARDRTALRDWGFTSENLRPTAGICLGVFIAAGGAMAFYGWLFQTLSADAKTLAHLGIMAAIYPIWGVVQQFLALSIAAANIDRIEWFRSRRTATILFVALLFGLVHFYDWRLAVATVGLELVAAPVYLIYRNLWPFGVLQGWLGALFYMWVLNDDLIARVFG